MTFGKTYNSDVVEYTQLTDSESWVLLEYVVELVYPLYASLVQGSVCRTAMLQRGIKRQHVTSFLNKQTNSKGH